VDDVVFDGFLERYGLTFSEEQRCAAFEFKDALNRYLEATAQHLDPVETLADPRWDVVRQRAMAFVVAFAGKWPVV
jgi:hypothetical protein